MEQPSRGSLALSIEIHIDIFIFPYFNDVHSWDPHIKKFDLAIKTTLIPTVLLHFIAFQSHIDIQKPNRDQIFHEVNITAVILRRHNLTEFKTIWCKWRNEKDFFLLMNSETRLQQ